MTGGADAKPTARRSRGSLSEEEIVAGALALAKRDGLENLSMPNLARYLKAGVMSLYWYFHSKDELLGAMAEHTVREVYGRLPMVGTGSSQEVIRLMTAFHTELQRTPLFAQLCIDRPRFLLSRPSVMPVIAGRIEEQLRVLQRLGLSAAEAMKTHNILSAYTVGFVLMQLNAETNGTDPTAEEAIEAAVSKLDPDEFPTLNGLSDVGALISLRDADFDDTLQLLVAGMKPGSGSD